MYPFVMVRIKRFWIIAGLSAGLCVNSPVYAQITPSELQGAADASRIERTNRPAPLQALPTEKTFAPRSYVTPLDGQEGAESFILHQVTVNGVTAFSDETLRSVYAALLGQRHTADSATTIAQAIAAHYYEAGYFLSIIAVEKVEPASGHITIQVTEGYIAAVDVSDDALIKHPPLTAMTNALTEQKPLKADFLESTLLRLNDIPGLAFRAVLSPMENAPPGAVKLSIIAAETKGRGSVSIDNYGSRFLGPHQAILSYTDTLIPFSETSVTALTSLPADELNYVALTHKMPVTSHTSVIAGGNITNAKPGYSLERFDIETRSFSLNAGLHYQAIRQRLENLAFYTYFDMRNSRSDLLNTPFTRDKIRALRAEMTYDYADQWDGVTLGNLRISQGLSAFGASDAGELNLSRAQAEPDFTKAEMNLSRLQQLAPLWMLQLSATGQIASKPLYSSEEFGYGGRAFGRGLDASEITGDHGLAAGIEIQYDKWKYNQSVGFQPYGFYDVGTVWNDDIGQLKRQSAATAGLGMRFTTAWQQSGGVELAWPLTKPANTPIYGANPHSTRLLFQLKQHF